MNASGKQFLDDGDRALRLFLTRSSANSSPTFYTTSISRIAAISRSPLAAQGGQHRSVYLAQKSSYSDISPRNSAAFRYGIAICRRLTSLMSTYVLTVVQSARTSRQTRCQGSGLRGQVCQSDIQIQHHGTQDRGRQEHYVSTDAGSALWCRVRRSPRYRHRSRRRGY